MKHIQTAPKEAPKKEEEKEKYIPYCITRKTVERPKKTLSVRPLWREKSTV